jgi:DNA (cytosine-5)-methyltransferase 1
MKTVDLFAGCGGLSLGFQNAGFNIVGAFERWRIAALCYEANFKHPVFQEDLSDVDRVADIIRNLNPEIIIGGPPCQDFSHAGKRVEDKRAALTEAYAKIVAEITPRYFVMENVDRAQNSATYAAARAILKDAGYGLTEVVLNASYCGAPQRRKRFFCIGAQNAEDDFLNDYITQNLSKSEMTLREYFGASLDFEYYYRHPRNYNRRAIYSIDEPSPTVRGMNRPVPPGYPGHPNDARELDGSLRALTTLERALIQTFPPNFKWAGNKTEMEQMVGNAVPVKLAEFVANALNDYIQSERQVLIDYNSFYMWLSHAKTISERTKRDIVSRLKRADSFCTILTDPEEYYIFMLEQTDSYKALSTSVRSQLKRAVGLYSDYRKSCVAVHG